MGGGMSYILTFPTQLQNSHPSQDSLWSQKTDLMQNIKPIQILKRRVIEQNIRPMKVLNRRVSEPPSQLRNLLRMTPFSKP